MPPIGSLNEKHLHAALKEWYARPQDRCEVMVEGFVIDIVTHDYLVEIQTRGFASIKRKLLSLGRTHRVRLVYPIAQEKWIVKPAQDIGSVTRRKSPKRGRIEDMFWEMVRIPQLITNPNFSLEVLFVREEEVRHNTGNRTWRTRGWATEERRLLDVISRRLFEIPADWHTLIPETLGGTFTTKDVADTLGISRKLAQKMVYCFSKAKMIKPIGKKGHNILFATALNGDLITAEIGDTAIM
jgi:hypothetical protein